MRVTFDSDLIPSYELTEQETQELEETGYCYDEEEEIGVVKVGYEYVVVRPIYEYDELKFNYGGNR